MKNKSLIIAFIIIIVLIVAGVGGGVYFFYYKNSGENQNVYCTQDAKLCPDGSYVSRQGPNCEFAQCPSGLFFDQTVSDGTVKISIPSAEFGLAVTKEQILVLSYIPPCDENFDYCLYYIGSAYEGTNFESAGIRIQKREDLIDETACLETQPNGYNNLVPETYFEDDYSIGVFSPLNDAAAGHYSEGSLYRLFYDNACYEFQTRIGQSQFANYPEGSIKEFTLEDKSALELELQQVLNAITLPDGTNNLF